MHQAMHEAFDRTGAATEAMVAHQILINALSGRPPCTLSRISRKNAFAAPLVGKDRLPTVVATAMWS